MTQNFIREDKLQQTQWYDHVKALGGIRKTDLLCFALSTCPPFAYVYCCILQNRYNNKKMDFPNLACQNLQSRLSLRPTTSFNRRSSGANWPPGALEWMNKGCHHLLEVSIWDNGRWIFLLLSWWSKMDYQSQRQSNSRSARFCWLLQSTHPESTAMWRNSFKRCFAHKSSLYA